MWDGGRLTAIAMRFKITFTDFQQRFIPLDYQSYLSAWIYKKIGEADSEFARFLHQEGYGEGNRRFKFFNFSPPDLRPFKLHKDRGVFELLGQTISMELSFYLPEIAQPFIQGLFMDNKVFIGDRINGVEMMVREVQMMANPEFHETMNYRMLSPCCVTRPPRGEEKYAIYLEPENPEFLPRLKENLMVKWSTIGKAVAANDVQEDPKIAISINTDQPKSKLITIKPLTERQTKIRGWLFDCTVTAPPEVQEFIYAVGLGEKGSLGFGMVLKND